MPCYPEPCRPAYTCKMHDYLWKDGGKVEREKGMERIKYECGCGNMVELDSDGVNYIIPKQVMCLKCGKHMYMNWTPKPSEPGLEDKLEHEAKTFLSTETTDKLVYYHTFQKLAVVAREHFKAGGV